MFLLNMAIFGMYVKFLRGNFDNFFSSDNFRCVIMRHHPRSSHYHHIHGTVLRMELSPVEAVSRTWIFFSQL